MVKIEDLTKYYSCALLIFLLWWNKPLDVEQPTIVQSRDQTGIVQITTMIMNEIQNSKGNVWNFWTEMNNKPSRDLLRPSNLGTRRLQVSLRRLNDAQSEHFNKHSPTPRDLGYYTGNVALHEPSNFRTALQRDVDKQSRLIIIQLSDLLPYG